MGSGVVPASVRVEQRPQSGPRPSGRIHLSAPDVGPLEERYLMAALRSGWVAPVGPDVEAFERELADRVGVKYAVAVNSGTAALHLGLRSIGAAAGTIVVIPTLTFVATANAAVYAGAEPVFVDTDPETGNVDVALVDDLLRTLQAEGRAVSAVVPVDLFGRCADYASLLPLCAEHGVPVVEDAAEALGAMYRGRPAGTFGRAAALSFNGNKVMTTSGGGAMLCDDADVAGRARHLACQAREPGAHWRHTDVGYNYGLSNLLAALGRAQLQRLDSMLDRRRHLRKRYAELLAPVKGVHILGDGDEGANCWLTTVVVDPEATGWRATQLAAFLAANDIETRPVFTPMHLQPAFAGARSLLTGAAERLAENGIVLPSGSALTDSQVDRVVEIIGDFLRRQR
ncbi:aminotransferase class I/II-fold pyridoxal phosphate-dependent enzyme [Actinoplanes sp. NPDC049548]|uniref:DegT/DnrJ/EryC1/StrS family aminotransferase n=1 Tax=Actinoplanes sp. NPDC049548 TaxID=3155152 RepID=UPI00343A4329